MTHFAVTVEHKQTGIRGVHYVQAVWPSDAELEASGNPDIIPISVAVWGVNNRFPKLPNFVSKR